MRGGCGRGGGGSLPPRRRRHKRAVYASAHTSFPNAGSEQQAGRGERATSETELAPCPRVQAPTVVPWQAGEGSRQGGWVGWGGVCAPAVPSSRRVHTHAHAHTCPASMHTFPTRPLGKGRGAASPPLPQPSRGKNPSNGGCGGLWLNQDSPRAPGPPAPSGPPSPRQWAEGLWPGPTTLHSWPHFLPTGHGDGRSPTPRREAARTRS